MPTSVGPNPPASRTATSPPGSAASHNLLKPCPSLARWSGSRRRRRRAEPSRWYRLRACSTRQACPGRKFSSAAAWRRSRRP
jgi:hypothetical protein